MYRDRDFDLERTLPAQEQALTRDLGLDTLFAAMGGGDTFLLNVAKVAVLSSLDDPEQITYRQRILDDCLRWPAVVRQIYDIAVEAIEAERKVWWGYSQYPSSILNRAVEVLQLLITPLRKLRRIADEHAGAFRSEGFTALFGMLQRELGDEYFAIIEEHLHTLQFRDGVLLSAQLGKGLKGTDYVLHRPRATRQSWIEWITGNDRWPYTFTIADRDEAGARALSELRDRGINPVANALAQSTDHILDFFTMLRREVGFYVGCVQLHERLGRKGAAVCFPQPTPAGKATLACRGLYDVCLRLRVDEAVVGNDVDAHHRPLVIITGANQGGKSTFLRSVGLAQLMMQAGMFVSAEAFQADVRQTPFTHYKREEDTAMNSGKLDEELGRMSDIADRIAPNGMLLFNESFAATNEREGSQIAKQIVRALLESGVKIFFVTHMFDLARSFYTEQRDTTLFLRAERRPDGERTFKLVEGEPLPTSYGRDLYEKIFDDTDGQAAGAGRADGPSAWTPGASS
jgi:DNA mismatch repair ATPase MutS